MRSSFSFTCQLPSFDLKKRFLLSSCLMAELELYQWLPCCLVTLHRRCNAISQCERVVAKVCRGSNTHSFTLWHRKPELLGIRGMKAKVNHIISSKRKKSFDNKKQNPQNCLFGPFSLVCFVSCELNHRCLWRKWETFIPAYLFQDGFSLRWLVSKAAQEELGQLDGEIGEEGKVSDNIRHDALSNKTQITSLLKK